MTQDAAQWMAILFLFVVCLRQQLMLDAANRVPSGSDMRGITDGLGVEWTATIKAGKAHRTMTVHAANEGSAIRAVVASGVDPRSIVEVTRA